LLITKILFQKGLRGILQYLCKMKKRLILLAGFTIVLVSLLWFLLSFQKGFFDVKLPVMSYVQDFSFTDQDGKNVNEHSVDGKVYVTEYFFTTCKGICPKMNANMQKVYEKFKNDNDFAIISHTSMPETDSVPLMKAYEEKMIGKNPNYPAKWYFVTGSKDSLYKMARQSYILDNDKNNSVNISEAFIHTQFFALVDKQKRVRGIYDGLKMDEIARLDTDIQELLNEKANP
jgi:protein SCO1